MTEVNSDSSDILCYIGLGSNLAGPVEQIIQARAAIQQLCGIKEQAFSSLYRSKPMGPQDQPDYVNAVMAIKTNMPPLELLSALQTIETQQGRVRTEERWGARTLDLDILLYGDRQFDMPELTVPHRGIAERAFVLYPLHEIAPDLTIPGLGALSGLLVHCSCVGLQRIADKLCDSAKSQHS
ncbi:MAG: 2-amino-4-hydroxy-6-hydroxymethyldihydropteridine diphosphokinase [Gammaproteobacteria bacterium]